MKALIAAVIAAVIAAAMLALAVNFVAIGKQGLPVEPIGEMPTSNGARLVDEMPGRSASRSASDKREEQRSDYSIRIVNAPTSQAPWLCLMGPGEKIIAGPNSTPTGSTLFSFSPKSIPTTLKLLSTPETDKTGILLLSMPLDIAAMSRLGAEGGVSIDFGELSRFDLLLSERVEGSEWLQVDIHLNGNRPKLLRIPPKGKVLTVLCSGEGYVKFFGFRGDFYELVESSTKNATFRLEGHRQILLTTLEPRGLLRLTTNQVPAGIPFSFGYIGSRFLGKLARQQGPISLDRYRANERDPLCFWTPSHGNFCAYLKDLRHGPDGNIDVELPAKPIGHLRVRADGSYSKWSLVVEVMPRQESSLQQRPGAVLVLPAGDENWTFPLQPGSYRLWWASKEPPGSRQFLPVQGSFLVHAGKVTDATIQSPRMVDIQLQIKNWRHIPKRLRPTWANIGSRACKSWEGEGLFTATLALPLTLHNQIQFKPSGLTISGIRWDGMRAFVDYPYSAFLEITVLPAFNGRIQVTPCYSIAGEQVLGRCWKVGDGFTVASNGQPVPVFVRERVGSKSLFMGMHTIDKRNVTVRLEGQWVEVKNYRLDTVTLFAKYRPNGILMEQKLAACPPGTSRLWLPKGTNETTVRQRGRPDDTVSSPTDGVLVISR